MYKVYLEHRWVLCLDVGPIPNKSHICICKYLKAWKKIQNPKHFWSLALQEVITQPMLISYKDKRNVSIISIAKGTSGKIMTSYNIV